MTDTVYVPHFDFVRRPANGSIGFRRSVDGHQYSVLLGGS